MPGVLRPPLAPSASTSTERMPSLAHRHFLQETVMGKYLLAWLLGVPGIVLLLVYLFFN